MNKKFIVAALVLGSVSLISMVAVYAAQRSGPSPTTSNPALVTEVPDTVPTGGVNVNNQVTLLPPLGNATISKDQAISIARKLNNAPGLSVSAARLTDFTLPESIAPIGSTGKFHTIKHVLAWVVTLTSPNPINVYQGPMRAPRQMNVTHDNLAINAQDGSFVAGFFTK